MVFGVATSDVAGLNFVVGSSSACRGKMATPKQAKAVVRMLVFIMMYVN